MSSPSSSLSLSTRLLLLFLQFADARFAFSPMSVAHTHTHTQFGFVRSFLVSVSVSFSIFFFFSSRPFRSWAFLPFLYFFNSYFFLFLLFPRAFRMSVCMCGECVSVCTVCAADSEEFSLTKISIETRCSTIHMNKCTLDFIIVIINIIAHSLLMSSLNCSFLFLSYTCTSVRSSPFFASFKGTHIVCMCIFRLKPVTLTHTQPDSATK